MALLFRLRFGLWFAFISLGLPAAHAQSPVAISPVALVDAVTLVDALDRFNALPENRALRDLIHIRYDRAIGRQWNDQYWPEFNDRWKWLRPVICPMVGGLCQLREGVSNEAGLAVFDSAFGAPSAIDAVAKVYLAKGTKFDRVRFLGEAPNEPLSFWASVAESVSKTQASIWEMSSDALILKEKEFLAIQDVGTYAASYELSKMPRYFGFTQTEGKPAVVLNLDKLKQAATAFATRWKLGVELAEPGTDNFDMVVALKLFEARREEFTTMLGTLKTRLLTESSARGSEALARFEAEEKQGTFPEEVYQHVAYKMFHDLISLQARYFALAATGRRKTSVERQTWESVLALQAEGDARAALYFTYIEGAYAGAVILDQLVFSDLARAVLLEEVQAVLGSGPYEGKGLYERLGYVFDAQSIPATPAGQDRRVFLSNYLREDATHYRPEVLLQLSRALIARITEADARALARHIHALRGPWKR